MEKNVRMENKWLVLLLLAQLSATLPAQRAIWTCFPQKGWHSMFRTQFVRFGEVFKITAFVILSKNGLLTGSIFKISCQAFKLGHPYVFVGYLSSSISRTGWLTPANAVVFNRDESMLRGVTGKGNVFFSFLNSQNRFPSDVCIAIVADCKYTANLSCCELVWNLK